MSKAEEKGYQAYPVSFYEGTTVDVNEMPRDVFIEGYHQAEKDLELTWKDIEKLDNLLWELCEKWSNKNDNEGYYEEVLKQFKDYKERKGK